MNNYVAASAYNFYPEYDRVPMGIYQPTPYSYSSIGNHIADRLYSAGMPNGIVNLGYRIGGLFDGNM